MNLLKICWKQLWSKPLSALLSLLLLAMAVAIISLLLSLNKQMQDQFTNNIKGVDMVVGAKGSPLQLILSAMYHIDAPTGNISLKETQILKKNPLVKTSIPLAYGDAYKGYRLVGTDAQFSKHYGLKLQSGTEFQKDFDVCVGASVAQALQLKIGDSFYSAHGLQDDTHVHDNQAYTVTGIYEPSNSVADKLILCTIGSVWGIHDNHGKDHKHDDDDHNDEDHAHDDHNHDGHNHTDHDGHNHDDHEHDGHNHKAEKKAEDPNREITAMLVKFRSPMGLMQLPRMINTQTKMMAALPSIEVNRLFDLMGVGVQSLRILAMVIMIISGLSVFISLFQSLKEQAYELALIRSMGASRLWLFSLIILQGLLLAVMGFVLGIVLSRIGLWLISGLVENQYQTNLSGQLFVKEELWLFLMTIGLGILSALIPALRAYRTDIAKILKK